MKLPQAFAAVVLMFATSLVAAPPPAPSTPPAPAPASPAAPTTRPSPEQLHAQAYQLMLAGQMQRATSPLEQAYRARPPARQPRALILNHAMLDITQKVNVMRAVKDLRDYLTNLPQGQVDEDAVDLLGAALQAAGKNPRMAELPLYKAGEKQLQNAIELLEEARPRERKWGQRWYRDVDFAEIRLSVDRAANIYKHERGEAERLKVALEVARTDAQRYNTLNPTIGHRHANPADAYDCNFCISNRTQTSNAENARANVLRAEGEYRVQQLRAEQAKKEIPQPDWTAVPFRPYDPAAIAAIPAAQPVPPEPAAPRPTAPGTPDLFVDPGPAPAPAPAPATERALH